MDIIDKFIGVQLEEIKGIVKGNGRNIADNSLRLMKIDDDIASIKDDTRTISEAIKSMQDGVATLLDLNLQMRDNLKEQREANQEIKLMFNELLANGKLIRRDIDSIKEVLDNSTVVLYDGLKVM